MNIYYYIVKSMPIRRRFFNFKLYLLVETRDEFFLLWNRGVLNKQIRYTIATTVLQRAIPPDRF